MKRFQYFNPKTLEQGLELLSAHPKETRVIAGGQDLLFRIKKQLVKPDYLVNIKGMDELRGLAEPDGESSNGSRKLYSGALETLTSLWHEPRIRERYAAVAEAARVVASPQIRNVGTLGGNLCQDVWCWYLQTGFQCWKNGGVKCDLIRGDARYYGSIFLGHRCMANHPSDLAPALVAFDAEAEIVGPQGTRRVPLTEVLAGHTTIQGVLQAHSLQPTELLKGVWLSSGPPDTRSTYSKFALRGSWDFAIAAAAVRLSFEEDICSEARIVLGGVATYPYRCPDAEALLVGQRITEDLAVEAGATSVKGARPFKTNQYKVDIARTLVKRAILKLSGLEDPAAAAQSR